MSDMAMLGEKLIGGFAYALEEGKTVDGDVISATYFPGVSPTTNWLSAGDILEVRFSDKRETDPIKVPSAQGGYIEDEREIIVADYIDLVLRDFNEWVHRLQFGLISEIVLDTAQAIFTETDRDIQGLLKLQGRQQSADDLVRIDCWGKFTLIETPDWAAKYGQPVLRFQKPESALNPTVFPS